MALGAVMAAPAVFRSRKKRSTQVFESRAPIFRARPVSFWSQLIWQAAICLLSLRIGYLYGFRLVASVAALVLAAGWIYVFRVYQVARQDASDLSTRRYSARMSGLVAITALFYLGMAAVFLLKA